LFADVDRALVMAAFADKLRRAGVAVPLTATERATAAVGCVDDAGPVSLDELYWSTRLSLVANRRDIELFDELFDAAFDTDHRARDRRSMRANSAGSTRPGDRQHAVRLTVDGDAVDGGGLPWATLPAATADAETGRDDDQDQTQTTLFDRLPSAAAVDHERPFDLFDDDELTRIGELIEASIATWPQRLSRRRKTAPRGDRPDLRTGLRRALRTGGEPLAMPKLRHTSRPRPLAVFVDVSGSMESFARAYLHVARALARQRRAEVFAFATDATRITASLRLRSPLEAIERASDEVGDRFGGTRLATSFETVIRHRSWGSLVRGAAVLVVSDGWDTDPPERLARHVARLQRMAHRVVWVNPRLAADDFEPAVAGMAAALPYCDHFLPGHSLAAMTDVLDAIAP
jgi:uncharacterized protein with von Willebrand factor type A (vWA) domain